MPKYLLTNEAIATERWKMLETNPAYSEDLTTKAKPGKSAVCTYFKFRPGVLETVAGYFPDLSLAKSGWRTESPLTGSFAEGTWTFKVRLENDTKYGFSVKVGVRVTKSVYEDGSYASDPPIVEWMSPNVIALPASAGGSVTDSFSVPLLSKTMSNEYLFAEYVIHIEVAGTSTLCQCSFACDENPTVADESITTPIFTPAIVETIVAQSYPMLYLSKPAKAAELTSKVEGATITKIAKDFPEALLKSGKAKELRSKFTT